MSFSQKWYEISLSLKRKRLSTKESGNICRRIVGSENPVFKTQDPMKHRQEWERNEKQCFRTKQNNKQRSN